MTTKLEQIERAICAVYNSPMSVVWEETSPDWKRTYRHMARAAVEAMREPNGAMALAGKDAIDDGETYGCQFKAEEAYRTMIQVILNEKP